MQRVGMLDSPFVRRVAISMKLMGLAFEHRNLSVFRDFDAFRAINPAVKAPTLVCDDGTVLMESTLILDHLESLVPPERRLMPEGIAERREALRLIGLALAAADKGVTILYEREKRPADKRHEPWLERSLGQALAGYGAGRGGEPRFPLADGRALQRGGRGGGGVVAIRPALPRGTGAGLEISRARPLFDGGGGRPEFESTPLD